MDMGHGRCQGVDLGPYLNHACASGDDDPLGAMGYSSFPAEELQALARPLVVEGVPFWLAPFGGRRSDNVRCDGQAVPVPPGRYCALGVLGASELGSYREPLRLRFEGGEVVRELALTRWILPQPLYGEVPAQTVTHIHGSGTPLVESPAYLWLQVVAADHTRTLRGLVLPDNILMHILALTLVRPQRPGGPNEGPRPGETSSGAPCPSNCPAGAAGATAGAAAGAVTVAAGTPRGAGDYGEVMPCPLRA